MYFGFSNKMIQNFLIFNKFTLKTVREILKIQIQLSKLRDEANNQYYKFISRALHEIRQLVIWTNLKFSRLNEETNSKNEILLILVAAMFFDDEIIFTH